MTITYIDGDNRQDSPATVSRLEPPRLLEYSIYGQPMRWELTPAAGGTLLTVQQAVGGREWITRGAAGWHLCLETLAQRLDGGEPEPVRGMAAMEHGWNELNEAYAGALGIPVTPWGGPSSG